MGGSLQIRIRWMKKCSTLITMSNQYQHYTSIESETWSLSLALTMTMTTTTTPTTPATHIWPACADVSTGFCDGLTRRPNRTRTLYGEERRPLRPLTPDHPPFSFLFATCSIWRVSFCERCRKIVKIFFKHFFFCSVLIFSCPQNWHYII